MLLSAQIVSSLQGLEEFGVVDAILVGGIGSIRDEIFFGCDVGRAGHLTGRLTHILWTGVVFAVGVVTEARVLKGMFAFGGMDVGFR